MNAVSVYDDRHLLIRGPAAVQDVADYLPGAECDGLGSLIVPWDLPTARRMAALDLPAVTPMVRDYDWPGYRIEPMAHQLRIANFLAARRRAFCFAGVGVGKTLSTAWPADWLMEIGRVRRVLVTCPLSIVNETWGDTLRRHFPHVGYSVLVGARKKRISLAQNRHAWHIINFDGVVSILDELLENEYDLIIDDESTAHKNPSTDRWKAMNKLVNPKTGRKPMFWALTGTPTPQGPMDAFGQAKLMNVCKDLPRTLALYRDEVMMQVAPMIWKPRKGSEKRVRHYLSPAIYVDKREALKDHPELLPPIYRQVEMTANQMQHFERMRIDMLTEVRDAETGEVTTVTAANAAVRLCKLLQIASGVVYDDSGDVVEFDNKPRINELKQLIDQSASKTLVFCPFLHVVDRVAKELRKAGYRIGVISGDVSRQERERVLREFQNEDTMDVLVAIPNSIAHGVDAYAASTTVWFLPQPRNEIYQQANGRIDRKGQKLAMTIAHLYSHPVEKQLYEAQQDAHAYERTVLSLFKSVLNTPAAKAAKK